MKSGGRTRTALPIQSTRRIVVFPEKVEKNSPELGLIFHYLPGFSLTVRRKEARARPLGCRVEDVLRCGGDCRGISVLIVSDPIVEQRTAQTHAAAGINAAAQERRHGRSPSAGGTISEKIAQD